MLKKFILLIFWTLCAALGWAQKQSILLRDSFYSPAVGFVFSSAGAINFCQNIKREMARDTLDWNSCERWSEGDRVIDVSGFSTQRERTPAGLVFKTSAVADQFDPYLLLEKQDAKNLPYLHLDCGLKDDFLTEAQQFGELIRKKSPRYSFLQMPGAHEVPYWQQF